MKTIPNPHKIDVSEFYIRHSYSKGRKKKALREANKAFREANKLFVKEKPNLFLKFIWSFFILYFLAIVYRNGSIL